MSEERQIKETSSEANPDNGNQAEPQSLSLYDQVMGSPFKGSIADNQDAEEKTTELQPESQPDSQPETKPEPKSELTADILPDTNIDSDEDQTENISSPSDLPVQNQEQNPEQKNDQIPENDNGEKKLDESRVNEILSVPFRNAVERRAEVLQHHMDNAAVFLREGRVREAMQAFDQADRAVSPEQAKEAGEYRLAVKEVLAQERLKPDAERDKEKENVLKGLERNLYVLERAESFANGNKALVLYQTGDIKSADQSMQKAIEGDPRLIADPNFNNRRREIEVKHGIKIMGEVFAAVDKPVVEPDKVKEPESGPAAVTDTAKRPEGQATEPEVLDIPPVVQTETTPKPELSAEKPADKPTEKPVEKPELTAEKPVLAGTVTSGDNVEKEQIRNVISPADAQGRSPVEQIIELQKQFLQNREITPEMKAAAEKAIADADKGISPKLGELQVERGKLAQDMDRLLNEKSTVGDGTETVMDSIKRIDEKVITSIDALALPAEFQGKLNVEQYRAQVKQLYQMLDESTDEATHKRLMEYMTNATGGNEEIKNLLGERDKASAPLREKLHAFNRVSELIPLELNQSATTRMHYAELLAAGNDGEGAKRYYSEAFATNQDPDSMSEIREAAKAAGADDATLLKLAIEQHEKRGGAANGKALEVENLLNFAFVQFNETAQEGKEAKAKELAPMFEKIQKLADGELEQLIHGTAQLERKYHDNLPQDQQKRERALELERTMSQKERTFTAADNKNVEILMSQVTTAEEKSEARQALVTAQPDWMAASNEWQSLVGDKAATLLQLKTEMAALGGNAEQTLENSFYSRAVQSRVMLDIGDKDGASAKLTEAFASIPKVVRAHFQERATIKDLISETGVDAQKFATLPEPIKELPPAAQVQAAQGPAVETEQVPGTVAQGDNPGGVPRDALPDTPPDAGAGVNGADRFKDMTFDEVEQLAQEAAESPDGAALAIEAFREVIRRADLMLADPKTRAELELLQKSIIDGKEHSIGEDGKLVLSDKPISEELRIELHTDMFKNLQQMASAVTARRFVATALASLGGERTEIVKLATEANEIGEKLPRDLMRKGAELLRSDAGKLEDASMKPAFLSSADALDQSARVSEYKPNPKYFGIDTAALEDLARQKAGNLESFDDAKEAYVELINRYDNAMDDTARTKSVEAIAILQQSLAAGKEIGVGPDGKPTLTDTPLSEDRRFFFHTKVVGDMEVMHRQVTIRQEFAQVLRARQQYADAEKYALDAKVQADKLPIDLMKKQNDLLVGDIEKSSNPRKIQAMQGASLFLTGADAESGAIKLPLNTRKFLTQLYLGTDIEMRKDGEGNILGIKSIKFGQTSAFKPEKAYEMAMELRSKTEEILGFDPMNKEEAGKNPGVVSLFAGLSEIFDDPKKYNLYDIVGDHQVENIRKSLKENSGFESIMLDIGVVALTAGLIVASRNPRVIAAAERTLGVTAPRAAQITRVAGLVAVPATTLPMRHYGYQLLTGQSESMVDSLVHVGGSLAAAEVGSRMLGRGSMFLGNSGGHLGPRAFRNFDATKSAEWLAKPMTDKAGNVIKPAYDTTGKLMDALKAAGFSDDAARFASLPRNTLISSPEAIQALERAGLTHAKLSGVADALVKDAAIYTSTGVRTEKLAETLGKLEGQSLNTVDDLVKFFQHDQKMLTELGRRVGTAGERVPVAQALGEFGATAEGQLLALSAERMGLKTVGEVRQVLMSAEKLAVSNQLPRIQQMLNQGIIEPGTKLSQVVRMGTNVFEGPGLNRLISLVPEAQIAEVVTPRALKAIQGAAPITGDKPGLITRAIDNTRSVGRSLFTSEGRSGLWTSALEGTKSTLGSVPTKLGGAREYFSDRFIPRVLDPATATPTQMVRARWSNAFYAAGSTALVYNSTAKTWDNSYKTNAEGNQNTLWEAFREAHYPTVSGEHNALVKTLFSTLGGTPGQALFGSMFLRQGLLRQNVLGNESMGLPSKVWHTASPLSNSAVSNWGARVFARPGLSGPGALGGTMFWDTLGEALMNKPNQSHYRDLLRRSQEPITNKPLPGQRNLPGGDNPGGDKPALEVKPEEKKETRPANGDDGLILPDNY